LSAVETSMSSLPDIQDHTTLANHSSPSENKMVSFSFSRPGRRLPAPI